MAKLMARIVMSSSLAMMAGGAAPAQAGVWNLAGQSQFSARYDDNVRLSTARQISAWNGLADLSGQMLFQDDAFLWRVNPRFVVSRYDGDRALNRTEQYVSMLFQQSNERGSNRLSLNGTQDTTLTSELGLTGLAEVNKKHRSWSANFAHTHNLTQRMDVATQLNASANYYLDAERTGLVDYNYDAAVISAGYAWSERAKLSLQASVGQLQVPDNAAYDKTNLAVTLGYAAQLTPRWRANLSYGPSRVRAVNRSERGSVYDASLTRASERMDLSVTLGRDVTATGRGSLTRREQLRLNLNKSFSERWSTNWSIAAVRNRDFLLQSGLQPDSVIYTDVTGNVSWRLTPTWSLSLSAGYTRQEVDANDIAAQRHHAALNVSWNGLMRRVH